MLVFNILRTLAASAGRREGCAASESPATPAKMAPLHTDGTTATRSVSEVRWAACTATNRTMTPPRPPMTPSVTFLSVPLTSRTVDDPVDGGNMVKPQDTADRLSVRRSVRVPRSKEAESSGRHRPRERLRAWAAWASSAAYTCSRDAPSYAALGASSLRR